MHKFPLTKAKESGNIIVVEKILPNSVTVSTTDSDSVCLGSNPSSAAMKKDIFGCLFSVIFVPCGTSDIYFVSYIALRAVIFAYGEFKDQI